MRNFLLAVVYLLVVVPAGFVARLVRDPLDRAVRPEQDSYWHYTPVGRAAVTGSVTR
ncbi:hypothetical protein [Micromonospora tarensis]|uniref:Uncharacterized protein n=1 Tax=Micromonospora tarensis TaxID=2806100 RepID=A0ABS1YC20_9ACTN|nr:hypothetical protein [Micromonospora tarensis]MBM0274961.1 hypothetical protein [Micromonospora tarensis]